MQVYISIGNSDDKLSQAEWSRYWGEINKLLDTTATNVYGCWLSEPTSMWQNACWSVEISNSSVVGVKYLLTSIRKRYNQDSIAWSIARPTSFL